MSDVYKFPNGLYEDNIVYVNAYSLFQFFMQTEQTDEFFKYLFFRINKEYKDLKGNGFIHVIGNDNIRTPLIDINYNFFIQVLGEWVEHYASNKLVVAEYKRYYRMDDVSKYRVFKITFNIRERVQFDYSYSGWLIGHKFKRGLRFKLVQVFFNNMLGGYTYVRNYKWYNKAMTTNIYLARNMRLKNKYVKFVGVSFLKVKLLEHYGKDKIKKLDEMASDYELIISTNKGIKNHMSKLNLSDDDVCFYDNFDLKNIEDKRDEGDGKYHFFESKKGAENEDEAIGSDEFEE